MWLKNKPPGWAIGAVIGAAFGVLSVYVVGHVPAWERLSNGLIKLIVSEFPGVKPEYLTSDEHKLALLYAAFFAIPCAFIVHLSGKAIRGIKGYIEGKREDIAPTINGMPAAPPLLHEPLVSISEIESLLKLHSLSRGLKRRVIADAIAINQCFFEKHYADPSGIYHGTRLLFLPQMVHDASLREAMRLLSHKAGDLANIDYVLYCKKGYEKHPDTNNLFAQKFNQGGHNTGIRLAALGCNETNMFETVDPGQLKGKRVILLETLLVFPNAADGAIGQLRHCGATVDKFVILFDGTNGLFDPRTCGMVAPDVIIGASIDLGIKGRGTCRVCETAMGLDYHEY